MAEEPITTPEEEDLTTEKVHAILEETKDDTATIEEQVEGKSNTQTVSLASKKTWDDLLQGRVDIKEGVVGTMKFESPSKIQGFAISTIVKNPRKDFIGQAQSGTGKTAAFLVSIFCRIDLTLNQTQAICLAPTRELARQIHEVALKISEHINNISIQLIVPLARSDTKKQTSPITSHVIIGTPGRVSDLLNRNIISTSHIKMFVLDEADEMLDYQGQKAQTEKIFYKIRPRDQKSSSPVQLCLFSATYEDKVREFAHAITRDRIALFVPTDKLSLDKLYQTYIICQNEEGKRAALQELFSAITVGQTVIFTQKRDTAVELVKYLKERGNSVSLLTGNMDLSTRDQVFDDFRQNKTKILVTTNVLARGVDVLSVTLVINYDLPEGKFGDVDYSTYLHRIGRSARYGKPGLAVNLVHNEKTVGRILDISEYFKKTIELIPLENLKKLDKILEELSLAYGNV